MSREKNKKEKDNRAIEFSPMAYLVRASMENRLGLTVCQEVADHLLNQVGVLADEHLEDLADFFRVVEEVGINPYRVLIAYRINPEMTAISEPEIERMFQIGTDHLRTVGVRRVMPVETVLDLDHTIGVELPSGMTETVTLEEAWRVALMSPLEAYVEISRQLSRGKQISPSIGDMARLVTWCRRAVGLAIFCTVWGEIKIYLDEVT